MDRGLTVFVAVHVPDVLLNGWRWRLGAIPPLVCLLAISVVPPEWPAWPRTIQDTSCNGRALKLACPPEECQ
uniref:K12 n=1 Tax=Human herpesvirus 8 TaxID=37296 RepID=A0A0N9RM72_HHV8|nr:K12 [Human gammaherpesvirus 8]